MASAATNENSSRRHAGKLGLLNLFQSPRDVKILCMQRFVRLFAIGGCALILAFYLAELGMSDTIIGLFMSLTLVGNMIIAFCLTLVADKLGRRNILAGGALLMTISGLIFGLSDNFWILLTAAVFGVISPSGNEIGPFRAIEESTLAQLTPPEARSDIFAWYGLIGTLGLAFGNISCGWLLERLRSGLELNAIRAYRVVIFAYAGLGICKLFLTLFLSRDCEMEDRKADEVSALHNSEETPLLPSIDEVPKPSRRFVPTVSKESASVLKKLCFLFAIDSIASGLVPQSWITYFFHRKFHLGEGTLGTLFFVTSVISALSNLVSSVIARRVGLVKAMVFTHLPSAVLLALIPIPNSPVLAMLFLILRSCSSAMDNAPRTAFLAAAFLPSERTVAMGVLNVVKTTSQSLGPVVTGALSAANRFWIAFAVAGGLKVLYDLGIFVMFVNYKTRDDEPEESNQQNGAGPTHSNDQTSEEHLR